MRLLFLEGRSSAPTHLALAWARALASDQLDVAAVGLDQAPPSTDVARVMREVGVDVSQQRVAHLHDRPAADHVISFEPTTEATEVWNVGAVGTDLASLRDARDAVGARVEEWLARHHGAVEFGSAVRDRFALEPDMTFVNHGSFGATPRWVLGRQRALQDELEAQPLLFMRTLPERVRGAATRVASMIGTRPDDLVFVDNTTTGVNAVLRSLSLGPGDALLTTDHAYGAVQCALEHVCKTSGARLAVAHVPFPIEDPQQVLDGVAAALTDDVRVAVLDHITSISGLVFPIRELVQLCHQRGVRVLVDGAHVPGQLPLDVEAIGADWYVGNLHKWLFSPKGCAVLHATPQAQRDLHPTVISHGYGEGFAAEFDWVGTRDPSPWLASTAALEFYGELGADRVRAHNIRLRRRAQEMLAARLSVARPAPEHLLPALGALPVPFPIECTREAADALNHRVWSEHRVEAQFLPFAGRVWFRVVAQVYNTLSDYERLAEALEASA